MNMRDFTILKQKLLKNPEFRKEYDKLEEEYALIASLIQKRIEKRMSQEELAQKVGTKQSAIARLESGNYNPSFKFLRKVAVALDTKLKISFS